MSRYQTPYLQYFDAAGKPLAGGKLYFYDAGTNDLKSVFTDIDQTIPATNPVTLNANGSVSNIFYSGQARVVLTNSTDTQVFDIDDVGPEDLAGLPPIYVSDATYSLNDVVKTADGLYYRSIQNANAGNTPSPSSAYWEKIDFLYTYNPNNSYQIDDVVKFGGQLYISTITANQGNSPSTSNNWRKLTTLAEFEYLSGGLTLNKVNYAVGTKAHVKSFDSNGGKHSYWVKQATTGPASKLPSERLDLQCTDALGAVWSLQHSGTVYISSIGGDEGADNGLVFRAYDTKADYLDLEGKTWPCTSLSTDNGAGREILQSKVFNGKLVVTNSLNGETNVQTFAPFLESEVQLSETKSPIIDWTGLNVLWLGTSIPHQAVGVDGYPERLAEKLNFTVQNWAWSGSHAFYDINGDAFDSGTVRALSMTEADRLAGLALYGSSSAYDDSFDIVTKASQMTTEYRIKRQFESGAIDCVVLDHNHNDRKNIAGYTANDKTINAVVKGTSTVFTLDDVGGLFEGDGCYVRVEGISELDYAAGRITGIAGNSVTVAFDSSSMSGTFTSGTFKFVDRNTVDGTFDFLIAYTKNMFIQYGSADGKIILCGAPSYFTNDVDRDHAIWSVNRSIKAIADRWGLSFFDVAHALRLTYRDHLTYLPDAVHPSTPETRKIFANIWGEWMNGGAGNFYNPEEVLQRNKLIDNVNNQPALYSKYDQSFATRDAIYTEGDPLINDDFSGGLGAWTTLGTGTPTVVSAPWGSGSAVQFDVLANNTAPYLRQDVAVGEAPVLEFDFYMPDVDVATGVTQQVTIASINSAGGAGYSVGIIQTVGGETQLRATCNQGGFGAAPVVPLPGATLTISNSTKYRIKIDVVDGYIFFSVDGNKLYAGAIDNSLLGAASSVLVGPTFTNMGSAFSLFISNVIAGAKSEQHVMTTEELQKTVQSYASTAEIEALSPTLTGARIENRERANAQYVLAPSGYVAQAGDIAAANGRVWELQVGDAALVEWFGVVGNDSGDYSSQLQGVVDRLNQATGASKGGAVVFGSGIYRACVTLKGRVSLLGAGRGATILKQPASKNTDVVTVSSDSSLVGWSRLTIDGNADENTSGRCIHVESVSPSNGNSFQPYNDKADSGDYSYKHIIASDFTAGFAIGDGVVHEASNFQIFYDNFTVSHCGLDGMAVSSSDGIYSNFYIEKNGRAGLWAKGSNNKYSNGKVIWNGRTDKTFGNLREQGTENSFVNVEAQDSYTDGILILGGNPSFIGCKSNQNGYLAVGQEGFSDENSADWRIGASATGITIIGGEAYTYKTSTGTDGLWTTQWPYYFNSYSAGQIKYFQVPFDGSKYNATPNVEVEVVTRGRMAEISAFSSDGSNAFLDINPQSQDGAGNAIFRMFRMTSTSGATRVDMHTPNSSNVQNRFDAKGDTVLNVQAGNTVIGNGAWDGQHLLLGAYHLWVDSTGNLRIKGGTPTSDTDGTIVGTQS